MAPLDRGRINGQGTYTYADGSEYVGEFRDGKYHGQGTYTFSNGDKYVGELRNDKHHGQGTYTYSNGSKYVGKFRDGSAMDSVIFTAQMDQSSNQECGKTVLSFRIDVGLEHRNSSLGAVPGGRRGRNG